MQKLSIIKFKPKPECFEEFTANITAFNETKHRIFHLMQSSDELHAIVIRNSEILAQDAADDGFDGFLPSHTEKAETLPLYKEGETNPLNPSNPFASPLDDVFDPDNWA
ncbi:hypothetical protein N9490_03150 [Planktomarina temperata]|nr:hypothetical protein [Planktomarina temperata]